MFSAIPLAFKIGGPLVILAALGGWWYWHEESLRNEGAALEREAALIRAKEQAEKELDRYREKEQSRLEIVERTAMERNEANAQFVKARKRATLLEQQVKALQSQPAEVRYETEYVEVEKVVEKIVEKPCVLDARLLYRFDDYIRVFNSTVAYYRLEGADRATEESSLQAASTVACTEAISIAEEAVARLTNVSIDYRGLSELIVDHHEKDEAAKEEDKE